MKPYNQYSASMRKTIRRLADNHLKGTRFREGQRGIYDALNRDGWCEFIDSRYAKITQEGLAGIP